MTDCLKSSLLSHLNHFLHIADDADRTNDGIWYDLDLLGTSSRNSQDLGVNVGLPSSITNIWKNIYKVVLTEKQIEDNKLDNFSNLGHSSNISTSLPGQLISTISVGLILNLINFHSLDILLPNNNTKLVCDQIQLLLPLNQLQHLIIKKIWIKLLKIKEKCTLI